MSTTNPQIAWGNEIGELTVHAAIEIEINQLRRLWWSSI